ncbi:hypothetical protein AAMO2058_001368300 [Amorphochlora amoebiformis]
MGGVDAMSNGGSKDKARLDENKQDIDNMVNLLTVSQKRLKVGEDQFQRLKRIVEMKDMELARAKRSLQAKRNSIESVTDYIQHVTSATATDQKGSRSRRGSIGENGVRQGVPGENVDGGGMNAEAHDEDYDLHRDVESDVRWLQGWLKGAMISCVSLSILLIALIATVFDPDYERVDMV